MDSNRRREPRKRMLRRARIVFRGGHVAIDCIVLDMSDTGARIRVGEWIVLPETFDLRIENGPALRAEVRFRAVATTGVAFVDQAA